MDGHRGSGGRKLSRPEIAPPSPEGLPITPRVCSVETAQRLGFVDASLFDNDALVEVVAFGCCHDEDDGEIWVAVRFTCDLPQGLGSVSKANWIKHEQFESLMPMRLLLSKTPDDIRSIEEGSRLGQSILNAIRRTSKPRRRTTSPSDGMHLAEQWRTGRRPVTKTRDWLERASLVADETFLPTITQVLHLLATHPIRMGERRQIVAVLELLVPLIGELKTWPTGDDSGPSLHHILESFSEHIDPEWFDEDPDIDD